MQSFELDGSGKHFPTDKLGSFLAAPGIKGKVRALNAVEEDPSESFAAIFQLKERQLGRVFLEAINANDAVIAQLLDLEVLPGRGPDTSAESSTLDEPPSIYMNFRARERGSGAVALTLDEAGLATWHLPRVPPGASESEPTEFSFSIPHIGSEGTETRSLLGWLGRKFVAVVTFQLLEGTTDRLVAEILSRAESRFFREALLRFEPQSGVFRPAMPGPGRRPSTTARDVKTLMLVHGTISSTQVAFQDLLQDAVFRAVVCKYDAVLGFDHKTLSKSPGQNGSELADALDVHFGGARHEMNILSHSRGGLVARAMLESSANRQPVNRLLMYGTPNDGTPLALGRNIVRYLNVLQILFSLAGLAATPVSCIFGALKLLAHGIWRIPGLIAQSPHSRFLRQLNDFPNAKVDYAYCRADFVPDSHVRRVLHWTATQGLMDGLASDAIVPYDSVSKASPGQSIRALTDFHGGEVHHNNFFSRPETRTDLQREL